MIIDPHEKRKDYTFVTTPVIGVVSSSVTQDQLRKVKDAVAPAPVPKAG